MRPIKLTMTAFGPYSGVEIVDFRELKDINLFLITGPTGSGKTTIFDAISFALYGEASGDMRSVDSLRSHFASEDTLTEVDLEFELKGIGYHIHRVPRQSRPRARGEGTTEQKAEAKLNIYGEKKPIIGIKTVNERIEDIIGLNAEQFKQIMMIPQGEFRKLLTSDSQDREKILRKLFDTSIYNNIQMKLDSLSKDIAGDIKSKKQIRDYEITKIEYSDEEMIKQLIDAEDKLVTEIVEATEILIKKDKFESSDLYDTIKKSSKKIEKEITDKEKARENNEKINQKNSTKDQITEMESKTDEISMLDIRVKNAGKALLIVPVENNYVARTNELEEKKYDLKTVVEKIKDAGEKVKETEDIYKKETSQEVEKERESLRSKSIQLGLLKDEVRGIEESEKSISEAEKICKRLKSDKDNNDKYINVSKKNIEELRKKKDSSKDAGIKLAEKREKYSEIKSIGQKLKKVVGAYYELDRKNIEYGIQKNAIDESKSRVEKITIDYKHMKLNFLSNQAAILAEDLKEGEACPVCGATHHLKLAELSKDIVTEVQLNKVEKELGKLEDEYYAKSKDMAVLKEKTNKLESDIKENIKELQRKIDIRTENLAVDEMNEYFTDLSGKNNADISELKIQIGQLEELSNKQEIFTREIEELEIELKSADERKEKISAEHIEKGKRLVIKKTKLDNIYKAVPEELRTESKLREAVSGIEKLSRELALRKETAREDLEKAKTKLVILESTKKQLNKDIITCSDKLKSANKELESKISEAGFTDLKSYAKAKLTKEDIEEYRDEVDVYKKKIHSLKEQYKNLVVKTKDTIIKDILKINEYIVMLQRENKELVDKHAAIESRIKNNIDVMDEVNKKNEEIGEKEKKYKVIGDLAKVAQGKNRAMITFERYVLAAFLEDILKAANIRLKKMTQGRYYLSRTEELERKNKQSGLELEVYDNYTGKPRHVKTLSGGESFKASLSMALGLADVVQSYAGGVQLDTMFIDEGFGTLDQDSLESAINCLIDLQKTGRLVGIISHVQELKERIDTRLEVSSTNTGSKTKFVVM